MCGKGSMGGHFLGMANGCLSALIHSGIQRYKCFSGGPLLAPVQFHSSTTLPLLHRKLRAKAHVTVAMETLPKMFPPWWTISTWLQCLEAFSLKRWHHASPCSHWWPEGASVSSCFDSAFVFKHYALGRDCSAWGSHFGQHHHRDNYIVCSSSYPTNAGYISTGVCQQIWTAGYCKILVHICWSWSYFNVIKVVCYFFHLFSFNSPVMCQYEKAFIRRKVRVLCDHILLNIVMFRDTWYPHGFLVMRHCGNCCNGWPSLQFSVL